MRRMVPIGLMIRLRLIGKRSRLRPGGLGLKFMATLNGVMPRAVQ